MFSTTQNEFTFSDPINGLADIWNLTALIITMILCVILFCVS